jgi:AraC-like DNA-binding protein
MLIGMPRAPDPGELPYTEIAPPGDLAPYVDRLWLRTTPCADPARVHRVLPDGCVDIIVHADRGTAELVGAMTRAAEIPHGPAELVAVRFKPGTAAAITRCSLAELTDHNPEFAELGIADDLAGRIVDAGARPAAPLLAAKIPLSMTSHARLAALVAWLRRRLADAAPPDPLVARAVALLSTGEARVADVAGALGVTRQYLARGFRREVGITPKQLARIARMQRAAAAIGRGDDLARLAVELGYFDQAHLTHDLRDLVGVTPSTLAAERPIAMAHLFGAVP